MVDKIVDVGANPGQWIINVIVHQKKIKFFYFEEKYFRTDRQLYSSFM